MFLLCSGQFSSIDIVYTAYRSAPIYRELDYNWAVVFLNLAPPVYHLY